VSGLQFRFRVIVRVMVSVGDGVEVRFRVGVRESALICCTERGHIPSS